MGGNNTFSQLLECESQILTVLILIIYALVALTIVIKFVLLYKAMEANIRRHTQIFIQCNFEVIPD